MISYMMNYLLTESIETNYSKINIMRKRAMEDKEIIEIFEKILKELDENIINDELDRSVILTNMNTILVYCNISEKFRKTYCTMESDIREMVNATGRYGALHANFSAAILNKREIEEVRNKYRFSLRPLILLYYAVLVIIGFATLFPETTWEPHSIFYTIRVMGLALFVISPLCVWRSLIEERNDKEGNSISDFINHTMEWKWGMDHPYKVPGHVSIRIPTEVFFGDHDYKYNERMMKSIQTCMKYNALQNINFEKSEKFDFDDVNYIRIGLSKDASNFMMMQKEPDDKEEQRSPLFNTINSVNAILKEYKAENGDESEDKFASLPQLKFHPPTTSKY